MDGFGSREALPDSTQVLQVIRMIRASAAMNNFSPFFSFLFPNAKCCRKFIFPWIIRIYTDFHMLVGGLEHFLFFHILRTIIPTDFHIFQMGWNHQPVWIFVGMVFWTWAKMDEASMVGTRSPLRLGGVFTVTDCRQMVKINDQLVTDKWLRIDHMLLIVDNIYVIHNQLYFKWSLINDRVS